MNFRHIAFGIGALACSGSLLAAEASQTPAPQSLFARYASDAQELVLRALSLVGANYRRGGESPDTGFDCSGLVRHVFRESLGLSLPRTSKEISHFGEKIDNEALQPGDLVFFNTLRRGFSHVGIYLGEHRFVHAPVTGGQVRIEDMRKSYWVKRFNGARRIATALAGGQGSSD
ncbi:MAG TPA: C40 family peptidase [Candidatus Desulfobacillus sp.]|nr:C40 family peptidase [Candidatus Desulfobacillus sp.]